MATYVIGQSDATGYNHSNKGFSPSYTQVDVSTSTGIMKAHGASEPFGGLQTCILEIGYKFDAPEAGRFKAAAAWTSIFFMETWQYLWLHGKATMKVEYVLLSSGYSQLEAKTVFYAVSDSVDEIVYGQPSKSLSDSYQFYYQLKSGLAYILAVRLTFTMLDGSRIDGLYLNSAAYVDANSITIWNGRGLPE